MQMPQSSTKRVPDTGTTCTNKCTTSFTEIWVRPLRIGWEHSYYSRWTA